MTAANLFVHTGLDEPDKAELYGTEPSTRRTFRALLHDISTPAAVELRRLPRRLVR
ncbi:hypothetical protein [Rhodococcoides fascians]|uniref:hypothetical protein n=1 Tax=Rhodococcoides fascians TaxID=1828 RepID=UPI0035304927